MIIQGRRQSDNVVDARAKGDTPEERAKDKLRRGLAPQTDADVDRDIDLTQELRTGRPVTIEDLIAGAPMRLSGAPVVSTEEPKPINPFDDLGRQKPLYDRVLKSVLETSPDQDMTASERSIFDALHMPHPEANIAREMRTPVPGKNKSLIFDQEPLAKSTRPFMQERFRSDLEPTDGGVGSMAGELFKSVARGGAGAVTGALKGVAALEWSRQQGAQNYVDDLKSVYRGEITGDDLHALYLQAQKDPTLTPATRQFMVGMISDAADQSFRDEKEIDEIIDPEGLNDLERFRLYGDASALHDYVQGELRPRPDFKEWWATTFAEGLGSTLPFIVTGWAGAGSKAGMVMTTGLGVAMSVGESVERAVNDGATGSDVMEALALGIIPGLTEGLPIEMLIRMPVLRKQLIKSFAEVAKVAVAEGLQEAIGSQVLQNWIEQYTRNPDQDLFEGVIPAGATGAGVGMTIAGMKQIILGAVKGHASRLSEAEAEESGIKVKTERVPGEAEADMADALRAGAESSTGRVTDLDQANDLARPPLTVEASPEDAAASPETQPVKDISSLPQQILMKAREAGFEFHQNTLSEPEKDMLREIGIVPDAEGMYVGDPLIREADRRIEAGTFDTKMSIYDNSHLPQRLVPPIIPLEAAVAEASGVKGVKPAPRTKVEVSPEIKAVEAMVAPTPNELFADSVTVKYPIDTLNPRAVIMADGVEPEPATLPVKIELDRDRARADVMTINVIDEAGSIDARSIAIDRLTAEADTSGVTLRVELAEDANQTLQEKTAEYQRHGFQPDIQAGVMVRPPLQAPTVLPSPLQLDREGARTTTIPVGLNLPAGNVLARSTGVSRVPVPVAVDAVRSIAAAMQIEIAGDPAPTTGGWTYEGEFFEEPTLAINLQTDDPIKIAAFADELGFVMGGQTAMFTVTEDPAGPDVEVIIPVGEADPGQLFAVAAGIDAETFGGYTVSDFEGGRALRITVPAAKAVNLNDQLLKLAEAYDGQGYAVDIEQRRVRSDYREGGVEGQEYRKRVGRGSGTEALAEVDAVRERVRQALAGERADWEAGQPGSGSDQARADAPGGSRPPGSRPDGRVALTHFSAEPRSVVSPAFQKTGKVKGAERERAFGFNYLPRSYYGINVGEDDGYEPESAALGGVRHDVTLDPRRLYNYGEDPLGLAERAAKASTDRSEQVNIMERLIKEAGFAGYWGNNSGGPVAVIYEALRPERVSDESGDLDFMTVDLIEEIYSGAKPKPFWGEVDPRQGVLFPMPPPVADNTARAEAFKEWFDESEAVDNDGKPLVLYHGTGRDFSAFDPGQTKTENAFFFTPSKGVAKDFAGMATGDAQNIMPVFLKMENPLIVEPGESIMSEFDPDSVEVELPDEMTTPLIAKMTYGGFKLTYFSEVSWGGVSKYTKNFETREEAEEWWAENWEDSYIAEQKHEAESSFEPEPIEGTGSNAYGYTGQYDSSVFESIIEDAKAKGYDGVIFREVEDSGGTEDQYAVFNPEQIKSVFSKRFDPDDIRIEFADFSSIRELVDRQPARDLDTLYGVAPTWQGNLTANSKDIAQQFGAEFVDPGIKARETAEEKLKRKAYSSTAELTDVVRGGFIIDQPEQADAIVDELRKRFNIFDEDWAITSSGYVDRKILVSFLDGTVGEVQIWPREMLEAKESGGHKLYEEQRALSYSDPRFEELDAEMHALYSTALSKADPEWARLLASYGLNAPLNVTGASSTASTATSGGGSSDPNLSKNVAASSQVPLSRTSNALTGTQPRAGSDSQARPSSDMMAGRPSQSTNFMGTSNQNVGTPTENSKAGQSDNRTRPSFAFEAKRQPGIATAPGAEVKPTSLNDVADLIRSTMDIVVRQGRITAGGKDVVGQHNKKTGVIRVRNRADVQTLLHEVAHSINETQAGAVNRLFAKHGAEMRNVYEQLYPAEIGDPAQQLREGFAEWFRVYSTRNDGIAARIAPGFTADFEAWMKTENPELSTAIQTIRDSYQAHLQNTSLGVMRGMVVSAKEPTVGKRVMREVKEGTLFSSVRAAAHKAYTSIFDSLHPVRLAMEELRRIYGENFGKMIDLSPLKDPYKLARNAVSAYSAGHVDIMHGVHAYQDIAGGPTTRGLRDVIAEAHGYKPGSGKAWKPEIVQAFGEYLVARRAVFEYERYHNGEILNEPVEATEADVQQAVIDLEAQYPAFASAAQGIYDFANALWKKKFDAGLITQDQYTAGLNIRDYVPFMRDMSDRDPFVGTTVGGAKTGKSKVFKRFKGSNRRIINPVESLMREAYETAMVIARNDVFSAMADLGKTAGYGSGSIIEKIPSMQGEKVTLTASDLTKIVNTMSNNLAMAGSDRDAATLKLITEEMLSEDMSVDVWRMGEINEKGEPIIYIWKGGKREAYRLADGEFGKELYQSLTGIGREQTSWMVNAIALPSTALRAGITAHPAFLFANYIRDQMSAWILTDVGYIPFLTGAKGVVEELRQKETARMYNAAMGAMGGTNVSSLDNARVKRDLKALERKGYIAQHTDSFASLVAMTELTETGTRLGIFQKAFAKAKRDGLTTEEALVEAAYVSRDYIDFSRHGSKMLAIRRMIPFLNAQLQGLDKMTRTLGGVKNLRRAMGIRLKHANNLPLTKNERADLNKAFSAWAKMSALAVLSLGLSQLYADDPEYEEISDYLRSTHWMVKAGPGNWVAIPKPFELAVLANMTERAYEGVVKKDPTAGERFIAGLHQTVTPPFQIPIVQTAYEIALNKDTFTGREIVPSWQQGLPPELQFSAYTSEFSKALGKSVGVSPAVIDHVITSFGATWGRDFLNASNQTNRSRPEPGWNDTFITQRFFRDYSRGATSSIAFWDTIGRTNGSLQKAYTGYREYTDAGQYAEAEAYLSKLGDDERAFAYLNHGFEVDVKRMHPARRAADVYEVLSGIKKELYLDEVVAEATGEKITIPRTTKRQLEEAIDELGLREQRNAMVVMEQPGWSHKALLPTQPLFDLIQSIDPRIADELIARTKLKSGKAKIYPFDGVAAAWPELKRRLLENREEATTIDLLGEARFGGEGLFTSGGYRAKDAAIGNTAAPLNPFEGM